LKDKKGNSIKKLMIFKGKYKLCSSNFSSKKNNFRQKSIKTFNNVHI